MKSISQRGRIDILTFKEFTAWCSERVYNGRWNMLLAMVCIDPMAKVQKIPFWKREWVWRERHEKQVLAKIVDPLNQKVPIDELARRTLHTPETATSEKEYSTMTTNEYQSQALRIESHVTADPAPYTRVLDGLMDLNGEAGEAIDILKKVLSQGHEFDREHMAKELGDIAWYLAASADIIGYDLETTFQMSISKLKSRYPDGPDTE